MMMFSLSSIGGSISASGFGPGVPNLGGSNSARTPATVVEFSLLEYCNWRFHERQRINAISVGKKRGNLPNWLCFTANRNERLFDTATTRCDGFAAVFAFDDVMPPADRCSICGLYFWWFRRDSLGGRHHQRIQGCQIDEHIKKMV